jgi:hypothetical protein
MSEEKSVFSLCLNRADCCILQYTIDSALHEYLAAVNNLRQDLQVLIAAGRSLGVPDDHPRQRAGLELQHRLDEDPDRQHVPAPGPPTTPAAPVTPNALADEEEEEDENPAPSSGEEGPRIRSWQRWCQSCLRSMGKDGAVGCVDQPGPRAKACVSCARNGHVCLAFPEEVRDAARQAVQDFVRNLPGDRARAGTRMNSVLYGKKRGTPKKSSKRRRSESGGESSRPRSVPRRGSVVSGGSDRGGSQPPPEGGNDEVLSGSRPASPLPGPSAPENGDEEGVLSGLRSAPSPPERGSAPPASPAPERDGGEEGGVLSGPESAPPAPAIDPPLVSTFPALFGLMLTSYGT